MGKRVVISDVRYPNEAESIKKGGGILIKIERGENPEYLKKIQENNLSNLKDLEKFMKEKFPQIHSSDYSLALIRHDFLIKNDLDKTSLEKQLEEILKGLID
jgi:hypothetical protein